MNDIAQIVASIGFPAAAFIMAGWYIVQKDKQHKEDIKAIMDGHKEEMKGVKSSLERLTTAIRELVEEWRKA